MTAPKCPDCFNPLLLGDVQGYGMTYACRCGYVQPPESPTLSPLGERLLAIRERYIAKGGKLYTREELEAEVSAARLDAKTATQDAPSIELVSERNRGRNAAGKAQGYLPGLFLSHWPEDAPQPEPEYRFAPGRKCAFDLAWPDVKVAVECEGYVHKTEGRFHSDIEKYNLAVVLGWRVLRASSRMLKDQPRAFVDMVRRMVKGDE